MKMKTRASPPCILFAGTCETCDKVMHSSYHQERQLLCLDSPSKQTEKTAVVEFRGDVGEKQLLTGVEVSRCRVADFLEVPCLSRQLALELAWRLMGNGVWFGECGRGDGGLRGGLKMRVFSSLGECSGCDDFCSWFADVELCWKRRLKRRLGEKLRFNAVLGMVICGDGDIRKCRRLQRQGPRRHDVTVEGTRRTAHTHTLGRAMHLNNPFPIPIPLTNSFQLLTNSNQQRHLVPNYSHASQHLQDRTAEPSTFG